MLALQRFPPNQEKCTPNIIPCRIHHDGPAKATKRFWSPYPEPDGSKTAYFRGRRLRSKRVKLPARYQGVIAKSTNRTLPKAASTDSKSKEVQDGTSDEDEEEEEEAVRLLENTATFDEIMVWAHDQLPTADDTYVKGVEEWIAFAEAIHLEAPIAEQHPKQI